jgi:hypothetical protein
MNSEVVGACGGAVTYSGVVVIMGRPDKPGDDDHWGMD